MQETFAKPVICAGTRGLENCQVFQVWPAVQMLIMQVKSVWSEFMFPIFQGSKIALLYLQKPCQTPDLHMTCFQDFWKVLYSTTPFYLQNENEFILNKKLRQKYLSKNVEED